ncbi:MAG: cysteine desulfurase [Steroidobacteraceae bacterium]
MSAPAQPLPPAADSAAPASAAPAGARATAGGYHDAQGNLNVQRVRADFPILEQHINGKPLVYLDSAASAQRPRSVIAAVDHYETHLHSNVHRGVHTLSQRATEAFEQARERVRRFLNARSTREIIFTRGTTEAINLVAQSFGRERLRPGDEILITQLEHHANIVPWQLVCAATGATLRAAPISSSGELLLDEFARLINERTRLIAVAHVSNALGTVLPLADIVRLARARGIPVLLDGAQAIAHQPVDVQALDCDFYAFSSHKIYGPTGMGVLYGREALLREMPPWQGGGDMILTVSIERSTWNELPWKFEAGTPNISGAIGLAAALDYVELLGRETLLRREQQLMQRLTTQLQALPWIRLVGSAVQRVGAQSFMVEGVHPHDVGTILDSEGIAVRTGHHCAMPVMQFFAVPATARASLGCYSSEADIDALIAGLTRVREVFA